MTPANSLRTHCSVWNETRYIASVRGVKPGWLNLRPGLLLKMQQTIKAWIVRILDTALRYISYCKHTYICLKFIYKHAHLNPHPHILIHLPNILTSIHIFTFPEYISLMFFYYQRARVEDVVVSDEYRGKQLGKMWVSELSKNSLSIKFCILPSFFDSS